MNYRVAELLAAEDLGGAGTKTINIDLANVLSELFILFKATNGANGCSDVPAANITKVEMVDGSDVLCSISGKEAQALWYYDHGIFPYNVLNSLNAEMNICTIPVAFGRYFLDKEYGFDPTKFANPQLKITWDEDVANTSTTVNDCRVFAHIFDELKPAPTAFMMPKEFYSYTPSASAHEYVTMPGDYPIRQMLVRAYKSGSDLRNIADEFKIYEEEGAHVWFEGSMTDWQKMVIGLYPGFSEPWEFYADTDNETVYLDQSYDVRMGAVAMETDKVLSHASDEAEGHTQTLRAETTAGSQNGVAFGYLPHHTIPILLQDFQDPSDWFVPAEKNWKTRIKAGSGVGTTSEIALILEQARAY